LTIDENTGVLTYAANQAIDEYVQVRYDQQQLNLSGIMGFQMTVVQNPIIFNPGPVYLDGNNISSYEYQFTSLVPVNKTLPLRWETTSYDGISVNEQSGLLTYQFSNLPGDQLLTVGSAAPQNIFVDQLTNAFTLAGGSNVLSVKNIAVANNCSWTYATVNTRQVTMNRAVGMTAMQFPANVIYNRYFKLTATNIADGFSVIDSSINLEKVRVIVKPETLLQLQGTDVVNKYTISTNDSNAFKTRPPNFLPSSYTGGSTVTFTWSSVPIAPVSLTWYPSTSFNQPAIYYPGMGGALVVPGFLTNQSSPYMFIADIAATATTISDTRTFAFTPISTSPAGLVSAALPTGATTISLRVTAQYLTRVAVSWTPRTSVSPFTNTAALALQPSVPRDITLQGFSPGTTYTFTYAFVSDNNNIYTPYTLTPPAYTPAYLDLGVALRSPVMSESERTVNLSWSMPSPRTAAVTVTIAPVNEFYPTIVVPLAAGTTEYSLTAAAGAASGSGILELGQKYSISYAFEPDPTGVYLQLSPLVTHSVIVRALPTVAIQNPTGATTVTHGWSVAPKAGCIIGWSSAGTYQTRNVPSTITSAAYQGFIVNTAYTFSYSFPPTGTREWPPLGLLGNSTIFEANSTYGIGTGNPYSVLTSSSVANGNGNAWNAFDKRSDTFWQGLNTDYFEIMLPQPIKLYAYQLTATGGGGATPVQWQIQGWNADLSTFIVLHEIRVLDAISWSPGQSKTFIAGNGDGIATAFTRYRFVPTTPTASTVSIAELRFFELLDGLTSADVTHLAVTVTRSYTPSYKIPAITLNPIEFASSSSVLLSWSFIAGTPASSGRIVYTPVPTIDSTGAVVTLPDVTTVFNSSVRSVTIGSLLLGQTYTFRYLFDAESSGVYGSAALASPQHIVRTQPYAVFSQITGGTVLKLAWQLFYTKEDGTPQRMTQYGTKITWSPATVNIGDGVAVLNADSKDLRNYGFIGDGATTYQFNFRFEQTLFTYSRTIEYSYQGINTYTPNLIVADVTNISVNPDKGSQLGLATLSFSWLYGLGSGAQFKQVFPSVSVYWSPVTGVVMPAQSFAPATSLSIPGFLWGQEYAFTFDFDTDSEGAVVGKIVEYTYRVPRNPIVTEPVFTRVNSTTVNVEWTVDPPLPATIVARPVSGPYPVLTATTTALQTNVIIYNLSPAATYQIKISFDKSATTWPYEVSRTY
jgi:hypothetical protein